MSRIEISTKGLAKLLANRPKSFALFELLQNAYDEDGVTEVNAAISYNSDERMIRITVTDDAPEGFKNLSHAYTLYAESYKKEFSEKRGRFNVGDKLIVAIAHEMTIITTKGTVKFSGDDRQVFPTDRRAKGSEIDVLIKGTKANFESILEDSLRLIPPTGIKTIINDRVVSRPIPVTTFTETLPTVIGEDLRPTRRLTTVEVFKPLGNDASGWIYEMGIPVVEIGDTFSINIMQKVPLNQDRDNIQPSFLKLLRALVLNHTHNKLSQDDFVKPWVNQAVQDPHVETKAVGSYLDAKYGKDRAIFDPTATESMSRLQAAGTVIIHGRNEASATWEKIREGGLALPAGQVMPTRVEQIKGHMPESEWTGGMKHIAQLIEKIAPHLINHAIKVNFVNDIGSSFNACYGQHTLTYNVGRLGRDWFNHYLSESVLSLTIHELAHEFEENHLSDNYYRSLCKIGARLTLFAATNPTEYPWRM